MCRRGVTFAALVLGWASGCSGDDDQTSDQSASIGGRVMVTGALRGARVVVEQLRLDDASGGVREVVGETTTDADGRFSFTGLGTLNGMFVAHAFGGELDDLATSTTIRLDAGAELRSLFWVDLFEDRQDVLVSPVGALVESLARQQLASGAATDIGAARDLAAEHVHAHFGDLDWSRIDPVSLAEPATSPVDAWRAAAVLGGYAVLADDVRNAAGASPQEVNAYTLTRALVDDIGAPPFDGNDGDVRNTGLQVGTCPAVDPGCVVPPETPTFCPQGACRTLCDLYSGTLRGQLSGAALKLVRSPDFNGSGINDTAFLPTARAIADNTDPLLFGAYCTDDVDRVGPTITFDQPPTPGADAWVRGSIQVRVRATDDIDTAPDLAFGDGLADEDGDPLNAVAATTIDTTALTVGTLEVTAVAIDAALNPTEVTRSFRVDNTAPVLTLDSAGFYVSGSDWWTAIATPTLRGTITEGNLASVTVFDGAVAIGDATVDGTAWWFDVPAATIPGIAGVTVRVAATDPAGNVGEPEPADPPRRHAAGVDLRQHHGARRDPRHRRLLGRARSVRVSFPGSEAHAHRRGGDAWTGDGLRRSLPDNNQVHVPARRGQAPVHHRSGRPGPRWIQPDHVASGADGRRRGHRPDAVGVPDPRRDQRRRGASLACGRCRRHPRQRPGVRRAGVPQRIDVALDPDARHGRAPVRDLVSWT